MGKSRPSQRGPLDEEMDILQRWFDRVYPQHKMLIHYKWHQGEHKYVLELKHKRLVGLPFSVPEAWFDDPVMEQELRDSVVQRLQMKTIQEIG